jgi:hypothetical protein
MLDVHPPHEPVHGWRDFVLHLITITIGLLIALSLEGLVEWQHHRHLVQEAQESLHSEIESNAKGLQGVSDEIHKRQASFKQDVVVLKYIIKNGRPPEHSSMSIGLQLTSFDSISWKTAQATGALSYMSYAEAQSYTDIYSTQTEIEAAEEQAARDAMTSVGPLLNEDGHDDPPTPQEAATIKEHIEVLQGQLLLVDSLVTELNKEYKKFLAAHPA